MKRVRHGPVGKENPGLLDEAATPTSRPAPPVDRRARRSHSASGGHADISNASIYG